MFLPTIAGYTLLCGQTTLTRLERLILSFTVGTGLLAFYLFGLLFLKIPFSALSIGPFFLPFLMIGLMRRSEMAKLLEPPLRFPLAGFSRSQKAIFFFLTALMVWKLFFVLFMIFSGPTEFWDSITLWNYKAKFIYYGNGSNIGNGAEQIMKGEFQHYPLNLPIIRAWIATFMGQWDEGFINVHSLLLFLCLLGLEYEFLKKMTGKIQALILTCMLTGIPVLVYNVLSGYADMAVGYYFLAATLMLFHWHRNRSNAFLAYAGILVSLAMFTKNEGTTIVFPSLFLTFLICLLSSRHTRKSAASGIVLFLLPTVVIIVWFAQSGALSAIITISGLRESGLAFHSEGLAPLISRLFVDRTYNLFWFGVAFLFVVNWRKSLASGAWFFLIPLVLSSSAIVFVFLFTPNVVWLINGTTINRTMLVIIPILTVTSGFLLSSDNISDKVRRQHE